MDHEVANLMNELTFIAEWAIRGRSELKTENPGAGPSGLHLIPNPFF